MGLILFVEGFGVFSIGLYGGFCWGWGVLVSFFFSLFREVFFLWEDEVFGFSFYSVV